MRRDQYRKEDGSIGGYLPSMEPVPRDDRPLTGIRINYATLRRAAMRADNGNFYRDFSSQWAREAIEPLEARWRWEDDGGR